MRSNRREAGVRADWFSTKKHVLGWANTSMQQLSDLAEHRVMTAAELDVLEREKCLGGHRLTEVDGKAAGGSSQQEIADAFKFSRCNVVTIVIAHSRHFNEWSRRSAGRRAGYFAMARYQCSLADVQSAITNGQSSYFKRLAIHMIGYEASCSWSSKFTYIACYMPLQNGRHCLKSVERKQQCIDDLRWQENRPVYRFQLKLADGSLNGRSVKVTIFNSVGVMLKRYALEFRSLPYLLQERLVLEA
ncbi:hypothetical protein R1sor_024290 [Riccia sorocarpa]|uniref:Uncharacterized protein n=1 Tax=Riccia sorocarpa TaxID=122646 RepID=A0ABD3GW61_9MARC